MLRRSAISGKSAKDLSLSESVVITGLLKAPSRFAPTSNPTLARKRGLQVLVNMEDAGFITNTQLTHASADLTRTMQSRPPGSQAAMYYADWVIDQLPDYLGDEVNTDIVVRTTLNAPRQQMAEQSLKSIMQEQGEKLRASQAALVSMKPDGAVVALLGGVDYGESQYNRATQSKRQPGSSFKLFVYLAGLEAGLTPNTTVIDQPISLGKWHPKNYTGRYEGEIPLRRAVAQSINTVAVQVMERAGRQNVINMAHRLGIHEKLQPDPSLALGTAEVTLLELTGAYAHLAAGGVEVKPYAITEIKTSQGRVLYTRTEPDRATILSGDITGMMNTLLSGVISSGTGTRAAIGRPAAGKTGTTSDYKDAWFMGYTPDLATGVWVGNDNNQQMKKVTGGNLPASIWKSYMAQALAGIEPRALPLLDSPSGGSALPWLKNEQSEPGESDLGENFWDTLLGHEPPREE